MKNPLQPEPQLDREQRREAIVLVHGYNNHYGEAAVAYNGFRRRQSRMTGGIAFDRLARSTIDVHWPGDADLGVADVLDFLVYPVAVRRAREAGRELASHLKKHTTLLQVHFIGHSMGCRVVLEAMKVLATEGGPRVGKVCLMAAAVPVHMCRSGGRLATALLHCKELWIVHSRSDIVLMLAFPVGQTATQPQPEEGVRPEAVGRHGLPGDAVRPAIHRRISGAGHSHYWGHEPSSRSERSAAILSQCFGFGGTREVADARLLSDPRPPPAPRPGPRPRPPGHRR